MSSKQDHLPDKDNWTCLARFRTPHFTLISLWPIAPAGIHAAQKSELHQRLESGEPNPLIVGSAKDFERLMDFVRE